jgi:hypothetical protein
VKLDASDIADLHHVITAAVRATLHEIQAEDAKFGNQLGYTEPQAAALLGVAAHVLRDCRLRGEISARKVGCRYVYSRDSLLRFLSGSANA